MSAEHFTHSPVLHRIFGRAVSIDPLELFSTVKNEIPTEIQPTRITQAVDYLHANYLRPDDPIVELHSSFYDVRMILHAGLDNTHPPLDTQEALGVATHAKTLQLLARIALCPSVYYRERIWADSSIIQVESREHLTAAPGFLPEERIGKGCPFAGDNLQKKLYPIFFKYASWAAQFCVYDYYEDRS